MAAPAAEPLHYLESLNLDDVDEFLAGLDEDQHRWLLGPLFDWEGTFAREPQREPLGTWRVWLRKAGRGEGKTRSGAEWIRKQVESGIAKRIALVGRTAPDVRDVMIEGESGILAVSPPWMMPTYEPSKRRLTWRNSDGGVRAIATAFTAEKPEQLRGPQHDAAWCDELASWPYKSAWDNLMLGLRIGKQPRVIVTTTPKPTVLLRDLMARASTVTTGGSTFDNIANLSPSFIEDVRDRYEGTSLGRQELYAELLEEAEGALWKRKWIDSARWDSSRMGEHPDLDMLVIAIDPAGSKKKTSSETGIVIAGRAQMTVGGKTRTHFFVMDDKSGRYTPNGWGELAINGYYEYEADWVIGERNNGGDLVESNLLNVDDSVPVDTVWASRGKAPRATPIAGLYEQGRVHHIGVFRDLEDQLCNWEPETGMESPDRLDALVWAITYMMPTGREMKPVTDLDLTGGVLSRKSAWQGEQ